MKEDSFLPQLRQFGANVRRLRLSSGYSQEGFADTCGLDRTYIGGVERGERNIGLRNVLKIAKALGVPPAHLLADIAAESGED